MKKFAAVAIVLAVLVLIFYLVLREDDDRIAESGTVTGDTTSVAATGDEQPAVSDVADAGDSADQEAMSDGTAGEEGDAC